MARPLAVLPRLFLVVAALVVCLLAGGAEGGRFSKYSTCAACVDAGFGWSEEKGKCGGYSTKTCPPPPAGEADEEELEVDAAPEGGGDAEKPKMKKMTRSVLVNGRLMEVTFDVMDHDEL